MPRHSDYNVWGLEKFAAVLAVPTKNSYLLRLLAFPFAGRYRF